MDEFVKSPFKIVSISKDFITETEQLGSKKKFWCQLENDKSEWLFKFCQENTGQHWSEKIAAEIAAELQMRHAEVDLAEFSNDRGSITRSFATDGKELVHGNQILAGLVTGYNRDATYRHSAHNVGNITEAMIRLYKEPSVAELAQIHLFQFFLFDALIGNTDRHHENWGILRQREGDHWLGVVAPSFDHASSLGRELRDFGTGRCKANILKSKAVGAYCEKGRGAIYIKADDPKAAS